MRRAVVLWGTLLFGVAGCGGPAGGDSISSFTPPATRAGQAGWLDFVDAPRLDRASARGVKPGDGTPEAAVTHFYASRLRGDASFRDVLLSPPSDRLTRALAEIDGWKFQSFELVGRKDRSADSVWIRVRFEIEVKGRRDGGTDEVGVRRVDGRWRIESVPT